nr:aspartyl protease family protein [uncultured Carboxylicivirga sp.]
MKKLFISLSILFVLFAITVGYFIINFSFPFSKLNSGEVMTEFVTDTIPFRYSCSGHILIDVKVNGDQTYPFIVDNGSPNFIFSRFAKELDLKNNGYSPGRGADEGWFLNRIKKIESVKFGNIEIQDINAKQMDFDFECQEDICGIIGNGVMYHFVWQIDFDKQVIIVANQLANLHLNENRIEIPLNENTYSHHLNVNIQLGANKPKKDVLVDLGSNSTLCLKEADILKDSVHYKSKSILGQASRGLGKVDSLITHKYYKADSLLFENSDFAVTNVTVRAATKSLNLLGLGFFEKYRTTISWTDKKLILEPTVVNPDFIGKTSGFSLDYNKQKNKAEITLITENTPATRADLKMNTEVVAINNMPLTQYDLYCKYRYTKFTSDTIAIRLKEGEDIRMLHLVKEPFFR